MKNCIFILSTWLVIVGGNNAAAKPITWNRGELVMSDGTVLIGELNYNWKAEIVRFKQGNVEAV